tara:strand:+ start:136 stop:420 length:285 start_codon:yes stop_codon:yes gene_type:complete
MEIKGVIHDIFNTQVISEKFKKREFILKTTESTDKGVFENYLKLELTQDKCSLLDDFYRNAQVEVSINLKGRKYEKNGNIMYFNTLSAWRIKNI